MTFTVGIERPAVEVADVIREHGEAFLATHGGWLSDVQRKTLRDLSLCRTAALGGHVQRCCDCGHERIAYNSCRNRHCPKCQALARARWLEREAEYLLPVEYHHVVFTLPQEVAELALANPALMYELLFQTASATLREVAANPKRLGAAIGVLAVLHTWGQSLHHHPHLHCVCSGGGLSCNPHGVVDAAPRWVSCQPGFFLPVRVLSRLFRGKYLALLQQKFDSGQLQFPGKLALLADPHAFAHWLSPLYGKEWVVYSKRPFGGPEQVLKYLARYTHRVAISNSRLLKLQDGQVTFRYKDYAADRQHKTLTLPAEEFLRRFVQHVLSKRFIKMRHYGLLANRCRTERLEVCRRLLFVKAGEGHNVSATCAANAVLVAPAPKHCCPRCGGTRFLRFDLPETAGVPAAGDTS
ncbi:MAG: IS91 family transposase [Acidobacteria bacterium]|nr:IS91 family transposase [Acidobacteriota bacterium]